MVNQLAAYVHRFMHTPQLSAGYILILNPEVAHDVPASKTSAMLLTVHLDGKQ